MKKLLRKFYLRAWPLLAKAHIRLPLIPLMDEAELRHAQEAEALLHIVTDQLKTPPDQVLSKILEMQRELAKTCAFIAEARRHLSAEDRSSRFN